MKQKICKEMHWSNDPINHTFAPPPPPPPGPFGDPAHPGHGPAFPPPNPYTAAWYYAYRPWIDPKSIGTAVPGTKFHVAGDANISSNWKLAQLRIGGLTNSNYQLNMGYDTTNNQAVIQAGEDGIAHHHNRHRLSRQEIRRHGYQRALSGVCGLAVR